MGDNHMKRIEMADRNGRERAERRLRGGIAG